MAALYNSTLYQEIAESLPPGHLRKAELERIGVPHRKQFQKVLVDAADALANLVTELVRQHNPRFPLLGDSLRGNVALTDPTEYAWLPEPGPSTKWGSITNVSWVDHLATHRTGSIALGAVHVAENLLGHQIEITVRGSERLAATITLKAEVGEAVAEALAADVRAIAASGGKVRDLSVITVPIQAQDIVDKYAADRTAMEDTVAKYHDQRAVIDNNLAAML